MSGSSPENPSGKVCQPFNGNASSLSLGLALAQSPDGVKDNPRGGAVSLNDADFAEAGDLGGVVAEEVGEDFFGVLAQERRGVLPG